MGGMGGMGMGGMGGMGMMNPNLIGMGMGGTNIIIHHPASELGGGMGGRGGIPPNPQLNNIGQYIGRVNGKDYYRLPSIKPPQVSPFVWNELIKYSAAPQQVKIIPSKELTNWNPRSSRRDGRPRRRDSVSMGSQPNVQQDALMNQNMEKENQLMNQNLQLVNQLMQKKTGTTAAAKAANANTIKSNTNSIGATNSVGTTGTGTAYSNFNLNTSPYSSAYNLNVPQARGSFGYVPIDNGNYGGGFGILNRNGKGWNLPNVGTLSSQYPWAFANNQAAGTYSGAVAKSSAYNDLLNNYYYNNYDYYGPLDGINQLQQEAGTPGSLAVMQSQQAIAQQLAKINAQSQKLKKGSLGKPGKSGYKYLGPFGPRLGKREGIIPTMMKHMDQMAANMHAVANHLHRINTGNVHGFGPIPLNNRERKVLNPTLKAYMNGAPIPGTKNSG
eukprot:963720_1